MVKLNDDITEQTSAFYIRNFTVNALQNISIRFTEQKRSYKIKKKHENWNKYDSKRCHVNMHKNKTQTS